MVRLALRVLAHGRVQFELLGPGPAHRERQLHDGCVGAVILRLVIRVAECDRADLRDPHSFRRDPGHHVTTTVVELLVVHVGDVQDILREYQHGDVAVEFGVVEVGFQLHQVGHGLSTVEGIPHHVFHELRIEPGRADVLDQARAVGS